MDLVINHIDGNSINDSPNNLELITQSANNKHRFITSLPVAGNRKINPEIAKNIRKLSKEGWTNRLLREKFNVSKVP
jgi:predicted transcriptional regulator of viral defense system